MRLVQSHAKENSILIIYHAKDVSDMENVLDFCITKHGIVREKERCGVSQKKALRQVKLALERGKRVTDFKGSKEKEYMKKHESEHIYSIVYNQFCYIVSDENVVITVLPLPRWFNKKKQYDGKVRIRNCKKYSKYYCLD